MGLEPTSPFLGGHPVDMSRTYCGDQQLKGLSQISDVSLRTADPGVREHEGGALHTVAAGERTPKQQSQENNTRELQSRFRHSSREMHQLLPSAGSPQVKISGKRRGKSLWGNQINI